MKNLVTLKKIFVSLSLSAFIISCGTDQKFTASNVNTDSSSLNGSNSSQEQNLRALARSFETIMDGILWFSEADYPWTAFYSTNTISANYTDSELHKVFQVSKKVPIAAYSRKYFNEFWKFDPQDDKERDEAAHYAKLKAAMEAQLNDVRIFKVGEPDRGELRLYIVGRTESGKVVGVQTISVET